MEKLETLKLLHGDYKTTFNRYYKSRKRWEPVDEKLVLTFMPGSVIEYRVKVGDRVKRGDTLLLFRAMKMNNIIASPLEGVVKSIGAQTGVNIPKGALLVELE